MPLSAAAESFLLLFRIPSSLNGMKLIRFSLLILLPLSAVANEWQAGKTTQYLSSGEYEISYHVALAVDFSIDDPAPMLVLFSPGGKGKAILNAVLPSAAQLGWTVVGVDQLKNGMEDELEQAMEQEVFQHIVETVPHHKRRIYLGGFSGGAWRSYRLSRVFEDYPIAGILAMGGWLGGRDLYDEDYRKYMAVAMVNGDKDKNANSWAAGDKEALEDRRCEVRIFSFAGGHKMAPHETITEALVWMNEDWEKNGSRKQR